MYKKINKKYKFITNINIFFKLFITIFIILILSFNTSSAKWINGTNDTQTKKVWNAFSKKHDIISFIGKKVGIKNPKSPKHSSSINEYLQIIAYFESHLNKNAKNPYSSASSYFQFINSSFKSSLHFIQNKIDSTFPDGSSIFEYSYQGQSQLAITLWYQSAKDEEIKKLFERDYNNGLKVYCSYHHTNCEKQLSPSIYRNLKNALKNWSLNKYNINNISIEKKIIKPNNTLSQTKIKLNASLNSILSSNNLTVDEKIKILTDSIAVIQKKIQALKKSKQIIPNSKKLILKTKNNYCKNLIDNPIAKNIKYKTYDVTDLESFLNRYENENLKINGKFEKEDIEAVKRFQLKYKKDILTPIHLSKPTGEVYNKTLKKINNLYCEYKRNGNPIPKY